MKGLPFFIVSVILLVLAVIAFDAPLIYTDIPLLLDEPLYVSHKLCVLRSAPNVVAYDTFMVLVVAVDVIQNKPSAPDELADIIPREFCAESAEEI